ncbi:hypothetical protein QBC34DRAFT_127957 [Podospora aff. communis PSN243]|uniref:Uncharacterized protein n=1 Tax=Podospora aff. communis PSN243 TaxID=3040156 RepID=A0AAV9GFX7_9PEZI|nr:hypothetical protein QBC34DRAFT_127957 [Podospora aff. communis PSN243]
MPSLWKSGAASRAKPGRNKSIRGTISAPIPIPTGLDDDEFPIRNLGSAKAATNPDDEFPIRQPGAGIASPMPPSDDATPEEQPREPQQQEQQHDEQRTSPTDKPRGDEVEDATPPVTDETTTTDVAGEIRTDVVQDIQPQPPSNPPPEPPSGNERPVSRSPPRKTSPKQGSPPRGFPLRTRTAPLSRATNPPVSLARYSLISDSPSGQTGNSKDGPQRKKSTLRSAFSKLFGRSRRKNGGGSQDITGPSSRESKLMGSSQHRSDPTALVRTAEKSPKRSTSLPLTEYDRPLRSHSIGPDDIMAIESARNSLQAEGSAAGTSVGGRRRAATTTSRLLFQTRARNAEFGAGLSPRPASTHGRGSRQANTGECEDPEEIGRAITSDSGNGSGNGNGRRRSRSLSGLQDLAVTRPGARRRSDEIRFWRESYDPGFISPLSSNAQEDLDNDDTVMMEASAPESPAVPPRTPPQPFNFGIIPNTMVGMKITQAVTQAASIETRIDGLETRTDKLERVVGQLCQAVPGFEGPDLPRGTPFAAEEPATSAYTTAPPVRMPPIPKAMSVETRETPRRYASSHRSIETTDTHSQISFGEAPTFIGSLHPPSSATHYQSLTVTSGPLMGSLHRPNSNSTVRGASSLPTMGRDTSSNDDAYASLAVQLETERAARQALEAQVAKLSERLNTLSSTMFAMIRAPSESRSQERLTPSAGGSSPLLQPPKAIPVPPFTKVPKPLSSFEAQIEDASLSGTRTALATADSEREPEDEDFQTPREEQTPLSFGAFGEELRPDDADDGDTDDPKRKKAARTLSLSQLTLKKGQRTQI